MFIQSFFIPGLAHLSYLLGGMAGIIVGAGLFAQVYPRLNNSILRKGDFGELTLPQLFKANPWIIILPVAVGIVSLLLWIEKLRL